MASHIWHLNEFGQRATCSLIRGKTAARCCPRQGAALSTFFSSLGLASLLLSWLGLALFGCSAQRNCVSCDKLSAMSLRQMRVEYISMVRHCPYALSGIVHFPEYANLRICRFGCLLLLCNYYFFFFFSSGSSTFCYYCIRPSAARSHRLGANPGSIKSPC